MEQKHIVKGLYAILFVGLLPSLGSLYAVTATQYGASQVAKNIDDAWSKLVKQAKTKGAKVDIILEQHLLRQLESLKNISPALYKERLVTIQNAVATDKTIRNFTPTITKSIQMTTTSSPQKITEAITRETKKIVQEYSKSSKTEGDIERTAKQLVALENVAETTEEITGTKPVNVQEQLRDLLPQESASISKQMETVKKQDNVDPQVTKEIDDKEENLLGIIGIELGSEEIVEVEKKEPGREQPGKPQEGLSQESKMLYQRINAFTQTIKSISDPKGCVQAFDIFTGIVTDMAESLNQKKITQQEYDTLQKAPDRPDRASIYVVQTLFTQKLFETIALIYAALTNPLWQLSSNLDIKIEELNKKTPGIVKNYKTNFMENVTEDNTHFKNTINPDITSITKSLGNIFDSRNLILLGEPFQDLKNEFQILFRIYVFGANVKGQRVPDPRLSQWIIESKSGNLIGKYDNITNPTFNNISLAGLLMRYLEYVEKVFVKNFDAKDPVIRLFRGDQAFVSELKVKIYNLYVIFSAIFNQEDEKIYKFIDEKYHSIANQLDRWNEPK